MIDERDLILKFQNALEELSHNEHLYDPEEVEIVKIIVNTMIRVLENFPKIEFSAEANENYDSKVPDSDNRKDVFY